MQCLRPTISSTITAIKCTLQMNAACKKAALAKAIGRLEEDTGFFPQTLVVQSPADIVSLRARWATLDHDVPYIVKPDNSCGGYGIALHSTLAQALAFVAEQIPARFVVQRYIAQPALFEGRFKFDVRLYVVVTAASRRARLVRAFVFTEGLARVCVRPYCGPPEDECDVTRLDLHAHLCNTQLSDKLKHGAAGAGQAVQTKHPLRAFLALPSVAAALGGKQQHFFTEARGIVHTTLRAIEHARAGDDGLDVPAQVDVELIDARTTAHEDCGVPRTDDPTTSLYGAEGLSEGACAVAAPFQILGFDLIYDSRPHQPVVGTPVSAATQDARLMLLEVNSRPSMRMDGAIDRYRYYVCKVHSQVLV